MHRPNNSKNYCSWAFFEDEAWLAGLGVAWKRNKYWHLLVILASDENLKSWLQHHVRPGWPLPIWRHTSDHLPPCNNEGTSLEKECSGSSTSCWNISSLDCRFRWERLSFSAGALCARQAMRYEVPVLATLCGWGSILWLKYLAKSTQVLVQSWKAQLGIICGQEANHYI